MPGQQQQQQQASTSASAAAGLDALGSAKQKVGSQETQELNGWLYGCKKGLWMLKGYVEFMDVTRVHGRNKGSWM